MTHLEAVFGEAIDDRLREHHCDASANGGDSRNPLREFGDRGGARI